MYGDEEVWDGNWGIWEANRQLGLLMATLRGSYYDELAVFANNAVFEDWRKAEQLTLRRSGNCLLADQDAEEARLRRAISTSDAFFSRMVVEHRDEFTANGKAVLWQLADTRPPGIAITKKKRYYQVVSIDPLTNIPTNVGVVVRCSDDERVSERWVFSMAAWVPSAKHDLHATKVSSGDAANFYNTLGAAGVFRYHEHDWMFRRKGD